MNDQETASEIRRWCAAQAGSASAFSWPTDGCGYDQHIKFVAHRNQHWRNGSMADFIAFALSYADSLVPARIATNSSGEQ